jgi:prepilin-type N-terminal cleavage/methylation domain-containing protein
MKLRIGSNQQKGFTLLEILLVVAAIAILAGIVILAINPGKQLGDTRNAERRSDINTILNAVYQFSLDDATNALPTVINAGTTCAAVTAAEQICASVGTPDCTGLTDLTGDLIPTYIVNMPEDPQDTDANGTNYDIFRDANGRVTVCAPGAEQAATIEVTR